MMKRSFRDRWADELESGRRHQGTGSLRVERDGITYECCLGVACDLAGFEPDAQFSSGRDITFSFNRSSAYPPPPALEAIGISKSVALDLSKRNDGGLDGRGRRYEPHSFPEIAAHLRTLPVIEG